MAVRSNAGRTGLWLGSAARAGVGLTLTMVIAIVTHLSHGEAQQAVVPAILLLASAGLTHAHRPDDRHELPAPSGPEPARLAGDLSPARVPARASRPWTAGGGRGPLERMKARRDRAEDADVPNSDDLQRAVAIAIQESENGPELGPVYVVKEGETFVTTREPGLWPEEDRVAVYEQGRLKGEC